MKNTKRGNKIFRENENTRYAIREIQERERDV